MKRKNFLKRRKRRQLVAYTRVRDDKEKYQRLLAENSHKLKAARKQLKELSSETSKDKLALELLIAHLVDWRDLCQRNVTRLNYEQDVLEKRIS